MVTSSWVCGRETDIATAGSKTIFFEEELVGISSVGRRLVTRGPNRFSRTREISCSLGRVGHTEIESPHQAIGAAIGDWAGTAGNGHRVGKRGGLGPQAERAGARAAAMELREAVPALFDNSTGRRNNPTMPTPL